MIANEYFGTLMQSVVEIWKKHLETGKYSKHKALDEYYKEAPELIDTLIEAWIGDNEKLDNYINTLNWENKNAIEGLETLTDYIESGYDEITNKNSDISSALDNILELIATTIYKLRELGESQKPNRVLSLAEYLQS